MSSFVNNMANQVVNNVRRQAKQQLPAAIQADAELAKSFLHQKTANLPWLHFENNRDHFETLSSVKKALEDAGEHVADFLTQAQRHDANSHTVYKERLRQHSPNAFQALKHTPVQSTTPPLNVSLSTKRKRASGTSEEQLSERLLPEKRQKKAIPPSSTVALKRTLRPEKRRAVYWPEPVVQNPGNVPRRQPVPSSAASVHVGQLTPPHSRPTTPPPAVSETVSAAASGLVDSPRPQLPSDVSPPLETLNTSAREIPTPPPSRQATPSLAQEEASTTTRRTEQQTAMALARTEPALFNELFGTDLRGVVFRQSGGTHTCYLLSALDNIFNHPQGKALLDKIKISRHVTNTGAEGYLVKFPGQPNDIVVLESELGRGVQTAQKGIQVLEEAYLKIPGVVRGAFDDPDHALKRIFGAGDIRFPYETIYIRNNNYRVADLTRNQISADGILVPPPEVSYIGSFQFPHEERLINFQELIRHAGRQPSIDVLSAQKGNHYYSVRLHQSTPEQIVLADPFDTSRTFTVPIEQFMTEYDIEGMRFAH